MQGGKRWTATRGRLQLTLTCVRMGADLCIALTGGDREHIGAVAMAQARPSLADPARLSSSVSSLAILGHKEDELARSLAARLSSALGVTVCVSCGIHLDGITAPEIGAVGEMVDELVCGLLEWQRRESPDPERDPVS